MLNFLRKGRGGGKKVKEGQAGVNWDLDLGVVAALGRTGSGGMLYGTIHRRFLFLWETGWPRVSWGRTGRRGGFEYLQILNKTSQERICVLYMASYSWIALLCSTNPLISWFGFMSLNSAYSSKSLPCLWFLHAANILWIAWKKSFSDDRFGFKPASQ